MVFGNNRMKFVYFLMLMTIKSDYFDIFGTEEEINAFLKSGEQFGYFTYKEF